jgi:hypothetical protein
MIGLRCFAAALVMIGAAVTFVSETARADLVGLVKQVRNDAYGTPPGIAREKKYVRFPIAQDELLETYSGAAMLVEFLDKTVLTLGPDARLVVDTFVYDPKSGEGTSVIKLAVGTFRFISGRMPHDDVRIVTPSAILGIRGSEAVISVSPEGETTVNVLAGAFEVSNVDGSEQTVISAAQAVSVSPTGVVGGASPGMTIPPDELSFASGRGGGGGDDRKDYDPDHGLEDDQGYGSNNDGDDYGNNGGDDDGDSCFAAGTLVLMADGGFKPIERVIVGDLVMAYDFPSDRRHAARVDRVYRKTVGSYLRLNDLVVTSRHPFAVGPDEWRVAGDLREGDRVIGNSFTTIDKTERVRQSVTVFNLTIGGPQTFYVYDGQNFYLATNK